MRYRFTALAVSSTLPPPSATTASKSAPPAASIARRIDRSVGSQWTSSKMRRAIFSPSMIPLTLSTSPWSRSPLSVTSRTLRAPRDFSSYPSSSVAPTPNFSFPMIRGMIVSSSTPTARLLAAYTAKYFFWTASSLRNPSMSFR